MKIQPRRHYRTPRYPTQYLLNTHPELLRLVPARWRGNAVVVSALAGVCVMLTASRGVSDGQMPTSRVAPIFEHGVGRGSWGGVVGPMQLVLPEDEARAVIVEEARKAGVQFLPDARTLPFVGVPYTYPYSAPPAQPPKPNPRQPRPCLVLDGMDPTRVIGYEYVSEGDIVAWQAAGAGSTLVVIDSKGTAEALRSNLVRAHPFGAYAVFYDPMVSLTAPEDQPADQPYDAEVAAREQLRAQVKDFIAWLKAQGVI